MISCFCPVRAVLGDEERGGPASRGVFLLAISSFLHCWYTLGNLFVTLMELLHLTRSEFRTREDETAGKAVREEKKEFGVCSGDGADRRRLCHSNLPLRSEALLHARKACCVIRISTRWPKQEGSHSFTRETMEGSTCARVITQPASSTPRLTIFDPASSHPTHAQNPYHRGHPLLLPLPGAPKPLNLYLSRSA